MGWYHINVIGVGLARLIHVALTCLQYIKEENL